MFEIELSGTGDVLMRGRFDAVSAEQAEAFLTGVAGDFTIDFSGVDYISSAGLGVLLKTHKRMLGAGGGLRIRHVNSNLANIFKYSGFDKLFKISSD